MKTSKTHPLQIAEIQPFADHGKIGVTFCPGKKQRGAMTGSWHRDLDDDLDAIKSWQAAAIVTLVEEHELRELSVPDLGAGVQARGMIWHHLPITDVSVPSAEFEDRWQSAGPDLCALLKSGSNVLVHCKGGLGRAGTIAARLLIELGWSAPAAIEKVRAVRPGAIETSAQQAYVLGLKG